MFHVWNHRAVHYFLIVATAAILTLPQIGRTSLWDDDESLNSEAAREMFETGEWILPTFNFRLRDAKPVLLYWCQIAAFHLFGVNEFAARLPSAIAFVLLGVFTYELGRRMYSASAGLMSALVLLTTGVVVWLGGFASHDAILLACTTLTFLCFWTGYAPLRPGEPPRDRWFVPVGIACGIGTLAKGPIAVVLPTAVIGLFLLWERQLPMVWNRRLLYGLLACWLIASPWYILVTVATRGAFANGFFLTNNVQRLHTPMESHGGSILYQPLAILAGFAPWSVFLLPALWSALRSTSKDNRFYFERANSTAPASNDSARRLLTCWIGVYLLFFSAVATKLPHYTAPLYPAVALLLAQFLARWLRRETSVPRGLFAASLVITALMGASISAVLVWVGRSPTFEIASDASRWAWIGLPAIAFGFVALVGLYREHRRAILAGFVILHVFDLLVIGHGITPMFDRQKAAPRLVAAAGTHRPLEEVRIGTFQYTQPSIVFYSQREVRQLQNEREAAEFLAGPLPAYLFVSEENWIRIQSKLPDDAATVVARRFDPIRRSHVVVVSNRPDANMLMARSRSD